MKVLCNYGGWFPVGRGVFNTPVWRDANAFRVYMAFLASATHREITEIVGSAAVRLLPGQLTATQAEICGITGFDRNAVRSALDVLKREGAVQCGVPGNRQFSVVTVRSFPFSMRGEGSDDSGVISLPTETTKIHQPFDGGNSRNSEGFDLPEGLADTNPFPENPPALYMNKEYKELNNKKEKNILFSSSSLLLILSLWRSAREQAGEIYCEDPVTLEGAALMAELWVDTGKAAETEIASAMARFVHAVKINDTARLYTLKTLANSFGTYLGKPDGAAVKRHFWTFTCDSCGYASASMHTETEQPEPYRCRNEVRRDVFCTGTMIPKRD
jgi:hypothetical protein